MKKFLKNTILFLLFTMGVYAVLLYFWGKYMPPFLQSNLNYQLGSIGFMHSRIEEVNKLESADILFIGSSHAYRGFDTRIFKENGINSFNLGSTSQTPLQTEILLKRYLNQINPNLIIYEVYPEVFSYDGVESALDLLANDRLDRYSFEMAFDIPNAKVFNTLNYTLIHDLLNTYDGFLEEKEQGSENYVSGGYVSSEIRHYSPKNLPPIHFKTNENQLQAFEEIVTMLEEKNISLLLIFLPFTKSHYETYRNISEFDTLMHSYANYLNFNEKLQLDDSLHFYDSHHMNQNGVDIFNRELIKILKER